MWGPSTHRHRVCVSVSSLEWGNPPLLHPTKQTLGQGVQPAMPSTQICMDVRAPASDMAGSRHANAPKGAGWESMRERGAACPRHTPYQRPLRKTGGGLAGVTGFHWVLPGFPATGKDRDGAKLRGWRHRAGGGKMTSTRRFCSPGWAAGGRAGEMKGPRTLRVYVGLVPISWMGKLRPAREPSVHGWCRGQNLGGFPRGS